jgi:ABC-type sugar transport system permease subunit
MTRLGASLGLLAALLAPFALAPAVNASTVEVFKPCTTTTTTTSGAFCNNQQDAKLFGPNSVWTRIVNTIIFLVGSVAVIMIVVGGLRYVLSGGDSSAVNGAKNTLLYAVVGLVVTVMSYAIVNFVLSRI